MNDYERILALQKELAEAERFGEESLAEAGLIRARLEYLQHRRPAVAALVELYQTFIHEEGTRAKHTDHYGDETNRNWSADVNEYRYTRDDGTLIAELKISKRTPK